MPQAATSPLLKILLVEDDYRLRHELCETLAEEGYPTSAAGTLADAQRLLRQKPDLLLLDLMLPDGDGLAFCRSLREAGEDLPIIAITARDSVQERVDGLDAGVDDYLVKPFSVPELLARVRSCTRRYFGRFSGSRIAFEDLWLDRTTRTAGLGSAELSLTPQEFDLLLFLVQNTGVTWSREQLLRHAWGLSVSIGDQRTVDTHIRRLRVKLEADPSRPKRICTVWGAGYRFVPGDDR